MWVSSSLFFDTLIPHVFIAATPSPLTVSIDCAGVISGDAANSGMDKMPKCSARSAELATIEKVMHAGREVNYFFRGYLVNFGDR
jgi:hypothetical protein